MSVRIDGAIDMHCHFGPDCVLPGREPAPAIPAVRAAREAAASGHTGLVLKAHDFATPALAHALEDVVPGLRVFGAITLDFQTGGLNARAVEIALRLGAKIVWLPTNAAVADWPKNKARFGYDGDGISVIDDEGDLLPETLEIMDLVEEYGAILATGHTSEEEHYAVIREFGRRGNVMVTHAGEESGARLDAKGARELADLGAMIELSALSCKPFEILGGFGYHHAKTPDEMIEMIRTIGPERCTLVSDYGWSNVVPDPAPGFQEFFDALWGAGLSEEDLALMAAKNPARLLGLE